MCRLFVFCLFLTFFLPVSCKKGPSTATNYKRTSNAAIIRIEGEADRLNPLLITTDNGRIVVDNIFMNLLTYDPVTLQLQPDLAKSLPQTEDIRSGPYAGGIAYSFEILDEATWDNGAPVTAKDYIFSLKAVANPLVNAAPLRSYLEGFGGVEIDPTNPKKFRVFLDEKNYLGEETVGGLFPVLPEYLFDPKGLLKDIPLTDLLDPEKADALAENDQRLKQFADAFNSEAYSRDPTIIKGCGPYELLLWETDQRVILGKKANWWGKKIPRLAVGPDSLIFKPIPNPATALAALQNEEIDAMAGILPEDFRRLEQDSLFKQRYQLFTVNSLAYYYIGVNARKPLLSEKAVRQALAHIIDADEIIREVFQGFGERIAAPVPPSANYYPKKLKPIQFNLEKAKGLLAAAGWKDTNNNGIVDKVLDGKRVELSVAYLLNASSETSRNIGLLIQDNARRAGVEIRLEAKEPTVLLEQLRERNFELISAGRTLSPLWNPLQNWHTQGDNRYGFGDATTDALIDEILQSMDEKQRNDKIGKLLDRIYDEQVEIFLFAPNDRIAIHKRFDAVTTSFTPGFVPELLMLNLK
jgi:peptide/nickel transport system substrate-binding protein